jgi:CTP synthase
MQCVVIEFARNVLGLKDAHSREMNPATSSPVIDLLEAQKNISHMGGTMRLGAYPCKIEEGTLAHKYTAKSIFPKDIDTVMNLITNTQKNFKLVEWYYQD